MSRPSEYADGRINKNFRLPPELNERLMAAAAERGVSANLLAVRAIGAFLDDLIPVNEIVFTRKDAAQGEER